MKKCIFFLLILILFLSGCWDKRELNEIAISMAIGIDKVEDEYILSAQVVIPSELSMKGGAGHSQITLFHAKGETMDDAIRKLSKVSPRNMYFGHLQMIVIGESLAKDGIGKPLDFISRNWEIRSDFYLVVAKEITAQEILNVQTPLESIPATNMFYTLKTSDKNYAGATGVTLVDLILDLDNEGKEPVLTGIQIIGDEKSGTNKSNVESIKPTAQIKYDGVAVFKEDKLVGWLTESEIRGYNAIINQVKRTIGTVSCPKEGKANIEVQQMHSKVKSKIVNGKPEMDLHVQVKANVGAVECSIDLKKEESIRELEKIYAKEVKETILKSIKNVQENLNSDIFGFGNMIYNENPKEWKKLKDHWDEEFPQLKVNVHVEVKIQYLGAITNSLTEHMKD